MFAQGGGVRRAARVALNSYVRRRPPGLQDRLLALREVCLSAHASLFAHNDLTRFEARVFSQNGEDGVLIELLSRVGVTNRYFVEFGIEDGTEGNSVLLADVFGWSGLFMEGAEKEHAILARKYEGSRVQTRRSFVTSDNINQLFTEGGVPEEIDLLSIDIDGNDLYVWKALRCCRPRIVVIEYNGTLSRTDVLAQPHDSRARWDGSAAFGGSLAAVESVAQEKGYTLVHTELTGTNAFFVRNDLLPLVGVSAVPRRMQNLGLASLYQDPCEPLGGWQTQV